MAPRTTTAAKNARRGDNPVIETVISEINSDIPVDTKARVEDVVDDEYIAAAEAGGKRLVNELKALVDPQLLGSSAEDPSKTTDSPVTPVDRRVPDPVRVKPNAPPIAFPKPGLGTKGNPTERNNQSEPNRAPPILADKSSLSVFPTSGAPSAIGATLGPTPLDVPIIGTTAGVPLFTKSSTGSSAMKRNIAPY